MSIENDEVIRIFKESGAAVILHEATHAFNAQVLKWNESNSAWFDEGMAKLVEDHIYELRGTKKSNLFLDDVNWIQGNMIYIRPPRGSITELKNYIETRDNYMENWSTALASPDMREFGYAFSELWTKEFVKEKISFYKYPGWIDFIEALPKTSGGKVQRFVLQERVNELNIED